MPRPAPGQPRGRILFIRGGAVGDFILTLPAIRLVRKKLPGNHIEILGYPSIAQLAVEWGMADRVAPLEHGALARFFVPDASLDAQWCAYFASFSVVISHLFDPDGYFHGNLRRAGVETLLVGPHRPADNGQPAAMQLAKPLESLALYLDESDAARPFAARDAATARGMVALHPGSGSPQKNWGYANWRAVCRGIRPHLPEPLLLISGEAEHESIGEFKTMLEADKILFDSLESRPLTEVAARLAECSLFLGHDSGISHLAAACGVPSLLVFGPTDPRVWAPLADSIEVIPALGGDLGLLPPQLVTARAAEMISRTPAGMTRGDSLIPPLH
jgi:heptosyltransferase-3